MVAGLVDEWMREKMGLNKQFAAASHPDKGN